MIRFLDLLKQRNEALFYFGSACLLAGVLMLVISLFSSTQVAGANAWLKPVKFAFSIGIYAYTMAWYLAYLPQFNIRLFNWVVIILLGFELVYIAIQAGRGQYSHYNNSAPLFAALYFLMAMAATVVTVYTAYIGFLFFGETVVALLPAYLWAIRLGIFIFVIFSLQGFLMGARLAHTVGAPDAGGGLPILNWSTKYGDLRIAHFIGMHALQLLPLISYYWLRDVRVIGSFAVLYFLLAVYSCYQALQGRFLF